LANCRAVAVIRVDGAAELSRYPLAEPRPLLARCAGADHGVPGLPAEAVRRPRGSLWATMTRVAAVPEGAPAGPGPRPRPRRHRPDPTSGCRMVQLRIGRGRALDVAATAAELARMTHLRSAAGDLVSAGVDVLLPAVSYPHTTVLRAFRGDGEDWHRVRLPRGLSLDRWLAKV